MKSFFFTGLGLKNVGNVQQFQNETFCFYQVLKDDNVIDLNSVQSLFDARYSNFQTSKATKQVVVSVCLFVANARVV